MDKKLVIVICTVFALIVIIGGFLITGNAFRDRDFGRFFNDNSDENVTEETTEILDESNNTIETNETISENETEVSNSPSGFEAYSQGMYDFTLSGSERSYLVYVPSNYNPNSETAIVFNFHGGGGSAEGHEAITEMSKVAESEGFLLVYSRGTRPDGNYKDNTVMFWNVDSGPNGDLHPKYYRTSYVDDVAFFENMLDEIESNFNVNSEKVFVTGFSNGGIFANFLACESDRVNGFASVAGVFWSYPDNCNPSTPKSMIYFHGTADTCSPYNGGKSQCTFSGSEARTFISAQETVDIWRDKNNCQGTGKTTYNKRNAKCVTYDKCDANTEVVFCTLTNGGHTWPGGNSYYIPGVKVGRVNRDISANNAMWDLFERQ